MLARGPPPQGFVMGEKLLAQRMLVLLRNTAGRGGKTAEALVDWANDQRDWLWPGRVWADRAAGTEGEALDWDSLPALAAAIDTAEPEPALAACVAAVAELLELDSFEAALLHVAAAFTRLPRLGLLRSRLLFAGEDLLRLAAALAGDGACDADLRVRRSAPVTLGLLSVSADDGAGGLDLQLAWSFSQILAEGATDEERLVGLLAGLAQRASLAPEDFADQAETFGFLHRLVAGAFAARAAGVNILIHGPPGTGKTEFARTLAQAAGARLYAAGETDDDGEEPNRYDRLRALQRAQRLLARRGDSLVLFDEMEDLFADAQLTAGGGRRAGSKIFVNRLLEENRVPTIWTTNDIVSVDSAHLRRMSFVLRMDYPAARARARIVARIASAEGDAAAARGLDPLLAREPESAAVARIALRSAALAGGGAADAEAAARSLLEGLGGGRPLPPCVSDAALDLGLYESEPRIAPLVERLSAPDAAADFSLLLTGPPGTGKTALAAHLAERLDRPLEVKRASDLLSKWVGGTEANIADAFAAARESGAVLLLDEVDSLLRDRRDAQHSWETTQVNELLTWMDSHPLPFVAATNFAGRLDPAALRRFVFKIDLKPMGEASAARAFRRFFGLDAPRGLARLAALTPGDFAVVKRQLRYRDRAGAGEILDLLAAEAAAKPEAGCRIGF
jgi:AAA+ superfamily predicted ATPase